MTPLAILQHIIVWLPMVAVGAFLVRAGLRGRRINDHPICRRCRFDLVGLGAASAMETPATALVSGAANERAIGSESRSTQSHPDRCPECGTELTGNTRRARRAIIDGERKKRWRLFALGLVLLLSGLTTGFWLTYKPLAKFPWTTWAPDWVLAEMVDTQDPAQADRVLREIMQRVNLKELSQSASARAVSLALRVQADQNRAWNPELGNFIEILREHGLVTEDQWTRYARQAVTIHVRTRPIVLARAPIPWADALSVRVGNRYTLLSQSEGVTSAFRPLGMRVENIRASVNGTATPNGFVGVNSTSTGIQSMVGDHFSSSLLYSTDHEPGPVRLDLEFRITVFSQEVGSTTFEESDVIVTWDEKISCTAEAVADGVTLARFSTDESLAAQMRAAFTASAFEIATGYRKRTVLKGVLSARSPPSPVAFEVIGRLRHANGSEEEFSLRDVKLIAWRDMNFHIEGAPAIVPGPDASLALILRPSLAAAARTVDLTEIWGEEIVIENVPITLEAE